MGLQEQTEIIIWYPISLSSIRTVWQTIINIEALNISIQLWLVNRIVLELWEVKFILGNTRHMLSYRGGTIVLVELQTIYKVGMCLKHENDVLYKTHTRYS